MRFTPDNYFLKLWKEITDRRVYRALEELVKKLDKAFKDLRADLADLESGGGVPSGAIIISLGAACPTGYTEVSELAGYHIRGVPGGGTVGDEIGDDTASVDTGVGDGTVSNVATTGSATVADDTHRHYFNVDVIPLTKYVRFCQKD